MTNRQFDHLKEMGIFLWQRKTLSESNMDETTSLPSQEKNTLSLDKLFENRAFSDILKALGINTEAVSLQNNHLNLGSFNWSFLDDPSMTYQNNHLITPSIQKISQSSDAKKALWQFFIQHNLILQSE